MPSSSAERRSRSPGSQARSDAIKAGSRPVEKVFEPASIATTRACLMVCRGPVGDDAQFVLAVSLVLIGVGRQT